MQDESPFLELEESTLLELLEPFERKVFLFIGHGSAGYANVSSALREADAIAGRFNAAYGRGEWLILFGGDPPSAKRPNIGNIVKHLATHHGVPAVGVQKRNYREDTLQGKGGVDPSCTAVLWYQDDEYDVSKIGPYGGTDEAGLPVGATKYYLGVKVLPYLAGVIALGGGPVSLSEAQYACRLGLPLRYVRCPALKTSRGGPCGAIDEWATKMQASCEPKRAKTSASVPAAAGETPAASGGGGWRPGRRALASDSESTTGASEAFSSPAPLVRGIFDGRRGKDEWPRWALPEDGICMTMHQPWASLMVRGLKRAEGREWNTSFRGTLWIHAGGHPPAPQDVAQVQAQFASVYAHAIPPSLPEGSQARTEEASMTREQVLDAAVRKIRLPVPPVYPTSCLIGTVDIVDVIPREEFKALEGKVPSSVLLESSSGYVFLCERPHVLSVPVSMRGQGKLWKLPRKIAKESTKGLLRVHGPEPMCFPSIHRAKMASEAAGVARKTAPRR